MGRSETPASGRDRQAWSLDVGRGEGGKTAVQAIRGQLPQVPIIALSSGENVADVVEAMRDGATDCLRSPVSPEELLLKVRMLLDSVDSSWDGEGIEEGGGDEAEGGVEDFAVAGQVGHRRAGGRGGINGFGRRPGV